MVKERFNVTHLQEWTTSIRASARALQLHRHTKSGEEIIYAPGLPDNPCKRKHLRFSNKLYLMPIVPLADLIRKRESAAAQRTLPKQKNSFKGPCAFMGNPCRNGIGGDLSKR